MVYVDASIHSVSQKSTLDYSTVEEEIYQSIENSNPLVLGGGRRRASLFRLTLVRPLGVVYLRETAMKNGVL